jgi:hypothetical protein
VADERAGVDGLAEPFFAGRDEVGGDGVAHDPVFKLKLGGVVGCRQLGRERGGVGAWQEGSGWQGGY